MFVLFCFLSRGDATGVRRDMDGPKSEKKWVHNVKAPDSIKK